MRPGAVIVFLWLAWIVSWAVAAFWSDRAEKRASLGDEIAYRAVLLVGTLLFFIPAHGYTGRLRFWIPSLPVVWLCIALIAAGILFAWWARIYLGRLWSGSVTAKADHHVVDTGPYGLVRHPIYTGILLAIYGTMIAKGTIWGILGALALTIGIWMKARLEERFLRGELGSAYDDYAGRVPMLVPFGPK
jgi:protein-S-isoprenylcysteine O-methyltransferase Ste14